MTINALNHLDAFENFSHCWNNPKRKGGKKSHCHSLKGLCCKLQISKTYFKEAVPEQEVKNCDSQMVCDRLTGRRVPSGNINFISDYEKHRPEVKQLDEELAVQTAAPHQHDRSEYSAVGG